MTPKRATGQDAMFGRYRLCGRLAAGGMAEVWAAQLLAPGGFVKPMVIKRVLPELAENPSFLKMLMTEARVAARLSHANICSVFELGEVNDEYYIAMEYLRGAPLSHLLKHGGPVSPPMAVALVAQACEGLHYAHEQRDNNGALLGLVHRDVSPHNLFVTVDGVVKVLDFGIAKVDDGISERTEEGKVKGKLTYMSPEQLAADALDRRTDVWALGVVLWELLTGKRLFGSGGPADTVDGIRNGRVPRLAGLGFGPEVARLDDVLAVALRVERSARFSTAAELRRAMLEAMSPTAIAGNEEIVHVVWERCGAEVRANDRRFDDVSDNDPTGESPPVTAVARLPLRADHTEPSVPRPDTIQDRPRDDRADSLTAAAVDTSPEIEVVGRTPSTASSVSRPTGPAPADPLDVDLRPSRWKYAAVAVLLVGAAAIGALYAIRTKGHPPPPAPTLAPAATLAIDAGSGTVTGIETATDPATTVTAISPDTAPDAGVDLDLDDDPTVQIEPVNKPKDRPRDRGPVRPAGRGRLYFDAKPWATIYVDGRRIGVTPLVGESLSAGEHTIKAVTEDGRTKSMRVTVPAGGDVRRKVTW